MAKAITHSGINLSRGTSSQKVPVRLVDDTDGETLETGVSSPTIQLSKNGGSFASASDGTWAEIGNGWYTVRLNGTDASDDGWLLLRVVKSGTSRESHILCNVSISSAEERNNMMRSRVVYQRNL
jgi:hypothetical protein|tara:strand:- start:1716 stop:2090 length:375 start_codon:yes stop_codon:yes gene_type:complete